MLNEKNNKQDSNVTGKKPVVTTRKTGMNYLISQCVGDGIFIVLAIVFFVRAIKIMESYWYRSSGETLLRVAFLFLLIGGVSIIYHVMVYKTYADLFENQICGIGMQGVQSKSFQLKFDKIEGLSVSKGFLNLEANGGAFLMINTASGVYKILTTEARAKEMISKYSEYTRNFEA